MGVRRALFRSGTKGGGKVSRGKVQMGWKRSFGLLGSARITGNQMDGSHPPPKLLLSVINLNLSLLHKADIRLKNEKPDIMKSVWGLVINALCLGPYRQHLKSESAFQFNQFCWFKKDNYFWVGFLTSSDMMSVAAMGGNCNLYNRNYIVDFITETTVICREQQGERITGRTV